MLYGWVVASYARIEFGEIKYGFLLANFPDVRPSGGRKISAQGRSQKKGVLCQLASTKLIKVVLPQYSVFSRIITSKNKPDKTYAKGNIMYERRNQPVLPWAPFIRRLMAHFLIAFTFTLISLAIGATAYAYFEGHGWDRALMNSALMLGGFGPIDTPSTTGGRLFISAYAIYIGMVFAAAIGIIFAPIVHRILHHFHFDDDIPPPKV